MKNKLIIITGPNASGKSTLSVELALKYGGEIVSADSRQVYKGLDLGSGKISKEEMRGVKHFLLDVAMPGELFTLVDYQKMAYSEIDNIISRKKQPFLVGGTGLYINAVADGYNIKLIPPDMKLREKLKTKTLQELLDIIKQTDPNALEGLDTHNTQRVERTAERCLAGDDGKRENIPLYDTLIMGTLWPRDVLYDRIHIRLDRRLEEGMIQEVENLRSMGVGDEFLYGLGLEYRYILMYLRGEFIDYRAFYEKLFMEIRHLAKQQMTWFRKRNDIKWIDMTKNPAAEMSEIAEKFLISGEK